MRFCGLKFCEKPNCESDQRTGKDLRTQNTSFSERERERGQPERKGIIMNAQQWGKMSQFIVLPLKNNLYIDGNLKEKPIVSRQTVRRSAIFPNLSRISVNAQSTNIGKSTLQVCDITKDGDAAVSRYKSNAWLVLICFWQAKRNNKRNWIRSGRQHLFEIMYMSNICLFFLINHLFCSQRPEMLLRGGNDLTMEDKQRRDCCFDNFFS